MSEEKKNEKLDSFEWDSPEDIDFFGVKEEEKVATLTKEEKEQLKNQKTEKKTEDKTKEKKETKKEKTEDKKSEKKTTDEEEESEEEKVTFFEESKPTEEKSDDEPEEKFFNVLAKGMKEQGVLTSVDIPEEELDEKSFVALHEQEVNNRVEETFEGFFEELDDDAKAFLKHKKDGGKTQEFFQLLNEKSSIPEGDLTDENYQKVIARYYFKNVEDVDDEDIEDKLTWLEDSGKLEKYSEKYKKKIEAEAKRAEKAIEKQRIDDIKAAKDANKAFVSSVKEALKTTDSVSDFTITKSDKKELLSFITEPQVKIGKNKFLTGLQAGLKAVMGNEKKLILLAKLIKSDFDTSSLQQKIESKKTIEMKDKLTRAKQNKKPVSSSRSTNKSLHDYF